MLKEPFFVLEDSLTARCLWYNNDTLYVGTCARGDDHRLLLLDSKTGHIQKEHGTPYLISDVALAVSYNLEKTETKYCYAALGQGALMCWDNEGFGKELWMKKLDDAAMILEVSGQNVYLGSRYGEIFKGDSYDDYRAGVKKDLYSLNVDPLYIYAGYVDGCCRIFQRSNGKQVKVLHVGKKLVRCATHANLSEDGSKIITNLFAADCRTGKITLWYDDNWNIPQAFYNYSIKESPYGISGFHCFGDYLLIHTFNNLEVIHIPTSQLEFS